LSPYGRRITGGRFAMCHAQQSSYCEPQKG
jgi:hypothetical protein